MSKSMLGFVQGGTHYQIIKTLCYIVGLLKFANEIRFLRQIKEVIKHYNSIRRYLIFSGWPTL